MIYKLFSAKNTDIEALKVYLEVNNISFSLTTDIDWNGHSVDFDKYTFIEVDNAINTELLYNSTGLFLTLLVGNKFLHVTTLTIEEENKELALIATEKRDKLLQESDWTDLVSASGRLGNTKHKAWQAYRQSLRDITLQPGYPTNITWPTKPL
jgi:hypothetical protein